MSESANVKSIDAIREFRAALVTFAEEGRSALDAVEFDINRTIQWLRHEQPAFWQRQVRVRTDEVNRAQSDLYRKQASTEGQRLSHVDERRALARAQQRLEEANRKLAAVRRWAQALEHEADLYRGQVQPLARLIDSGVPATVARLDRAAQRLEEYFAIAPAAGADEPGEAVVGDEITGMKRPVEPIMEGSDDESQFRPGDASGRGEATEREVDSDQSDLERPGEPRD
jgi:hypothetical protein